MKIRGGGSVDDRHRSRGGLWKGRTGPRALATAALALATFAVLPAQPLTAQAPSLRTQIGWVAGHVAGATVGVETRIPLGAKPPLPLPGRGGTGPIVAATRRWTLTGMFTVGLNAAPPERDGDANAVEGLGYAHAGVMYRTGSSLPNAIGGVVALYFPVDAVGPALIVEATDLIALQGGALRTNRGWMGHAALSVSVRFLDDIF